MWTLLPCVPPSTNLSGLSESSNCKSLFTTAFDRPPAASTTRTNGTERQAPRVETPADPEEIATVPPPNVNGLADTPQPLNVNTPYRRQLLSAIQSHPIHAIKTCTLDAADAALAAFPPFFNQPKQVPASANQTLRYIASANFVVQMSASDLDFYGLLEVKRLLWASEASVALLQVYMGLTFGDDDRGRARSLERLIIPIRINDMEFCPQAICAAGITSSEIDVEMRTPRKRRDELAGWHPSMAHEIFHIVQYSLIGYDRHVITDWDATGFLECTATIPKVVYRCYEQQNYRLTQSSVLLQQNAHKVDIRRVGAVNFSYSYNQGWYWVMIIKEYGFPMFARLMNDAGPTTTLERIVSLTGMANTLELMHWWCKKYAYYMSVQNVGDTWFSLIVRNTPAAQVFRIDDVEYYGFFYVKTNKNLTITVQGTPHVKVAVCTGVAVETLERNAQDQYLVHVESGSKVVGITTVRTLEYSPPTPSVGPSIRIVVD